jgi:excisionase family DNA binding protein
MVASKVSSWARQQSDGGAAQVSQTPFCASEAHAGSVTVGDSGTCVGAGYRARTGDIQLGKQEGRPEQGVGGAGRTLQVGDKITTGGASRSQEFRSVAPVRSPFVTRLLPGSIATAPHLQGMRGGKDGLLSVREVAEQLGLCTATVYGLCAEGALALVRILNAIRIAPADLATFVEARRIGSRR